MEGEKRFAETAWDAQPPKRPRQRSSSSKPPEQGDSPSADLYTAQPRNKARNDESRAVPKDAGDVPRRKFPETTNTGSKGMLNPSNLCYRNAGLQALFHAPAFYHFINMVHSKCSIKIESCVLCALQELLSDYWDTSGARNSQSGIPEVSRNALHTLTAACKRNLPMSKLCASEIQKDRQSDAFFFIEYLIRERIGQAKNMDLSLYNYFFEVGIHRSWKCDKCKNVTVSTPQTTELGFTVEFVKIGEEHDIGWYLYHAYFAQELHIWCDSDQCKVSKARKQTEDGPERRVKQTITRAPEILFLRIARFDLPRDKTGKVTGRARKVKRSIRYFEILNLNPYRHKSMSDDCVYRLDGVVAHRGDSADSGHYKAAVRTQASRYEVINDKVRDGSSSYFQLMQTLKDPHDTGSGSKADFDPYFLVYSKL